MDFNTNSFVCYLILGTLVYLGESSVISPNAEPSLKEVDKLKVDEWVRLFYDRCGETDVVEFQGSCGPANTTGPYCNTEVVKTCIGDRAGCIEDMNCYFAVAISETAEYTPSFVDPNPSTTLPALFDKYNRTVTKFDVKVLDACHLKPIAGDEASPPSKFVGVGFGPLDKTNVTKIDCQREPTLTDFRAYFFVNDINHCKLQPELPVYPYIYTLASQPGTPDLPIVENQFTITVDNWQSNECPNLNEYIPATTDLSVQSNFMSNLLVYYYGTPNYVKNYNYTDAATWTTELKGDNTLPTYFHPIAKDREVTTTEKPQTGGSDFIQPSVYLSVTLIFSVCKSFF